MNMHKILERLILSFILLNAILLIINVGQNINRYCLSNQRIEAIKGILSKEGIDVDTELPRVYTPKRKYFAEFKDYTLANKEQMVKYIFGNSMNNVKVSIPNASADSSNAERIYTKDSEKVSFEGREIIYENSSVDKTDAAISIEYVKGLCRDFINRIGKSRDYNNAHIEYEKQGEKYEVIYYPSIKGLPIFSTYIKFEVYADGIRSARMYFVNIDSKDSSSASKEICPIDLVLFKIGDYVEKNEKLHITNVQLGYGSSTAYETSLLGEEIIPVYKITIEGLDSDIFVNAYTNELVE